MTGKRSKFINTTLKERLIGRRDCLREELGATKVIDMATLTGAVAIALGDVNTAVLGTDQA